jgi:hypothetical protein
VKRKRNSFRERKCLEGDGNNNKKLKNENKKYKLVTGNQLVVKRK